MMLTSLTPVRVGNLVSAVSTWNPATDAPHEQFSYIDIAAIDAAAKSVREPSVLRGGDAPSRARQLVATGDVLVSTVRPNLNAVAMVPPDLDGATASTGFCVLRPRSDCLHGPYLFHWVRTTAFITEMTKLATGASYPAVSDRIVCNSEIPIPCPENPARSLAEQKRIATILDKADGIRRRREQSINIGASFLRDAYLHTFGDPVTNPQRLPIRDLGEVAVFVSGGTPSKERSDYWEGTFPWVSPKDMKVLEIEDAIDHVSEVAFSETTLKQIPEKTLLIVVRGMILDHTVPIAITRTRVAINQDMKAICVHDDGPNPVYLLGCLLSQHAHILSKVSTAAHGTKRLEVQDLEKLPVLLPSLCDQKQFERVWLRFIGSRNRMAEASCIASRMFDSLVHKAFRGEL